MATRLSRRSGTALVPLAALIVLLGGPTAALALPKAEVDVTTITFPGSLMVGLASSELQFRVTSIGTDPVRLLKWKLLGAHPGDFRVAGGGFFITHQPVDLLPGEWCLGQVQFRPTAPGARSADLVIETSDPLRPQILIPLSGHAIPGAPDLRVTSTSVAFGLQRLKVMSAPQVVTLQNVGSAPLTVTRISAADTRFHVHHLCTVLAPASSCPVEVSFQPEFLTLHVSQLTIETDDPQGVVVLPLSGTGAAQHLGVATPLQFGSTIVGTPFSRDVVIQNLTPPGMGHLHVTGVSLFGPQAADFSASPLGSCADVPEGGSCTLTVVFRPRASGPSTAALHLTSDSDGSPGTIHGVGLFGSGLFLPPPPPLVPIVPPTNDLQFVGPGVPTTCAANGTPVAVTVAVTRAFGSRNPSPPATPPPTVAAAVASGAMAPMATLDLMVFNQGPSALHSVFVNGTAIPAGGIVPPAGVWSQQTVTVPVGLLRFPGVAFIGSTPTAANLVTLSPDAGGLGACVSVDWAMLSVKAASPVILVHGDGSDGAFFARQGMTAALNAAGIPNDSSVNLAGGGSATVAANAATLQTLLPRIVRSFGVNSVHLVTHSKGGLDARLWLSVNAAANAPRFRVLSLTTLGTPHLGSPLADLELAVAGGAMVAGVPIGPALLPFRPSAPDLSTAAGAAFDPPLPGGVYQMIAADADAVPDRMIRSLPVDEYAAARRESSALAAIFAADMAATGGSARTDVLVSAVHLFLRGTGAVAAIPIPIPIPGVPLLTGVLVLPIAAPPMANDLLVRADSALGARAPFAEALGTGMGTIFGDHAAVAGPVGAAVVGPFVIATDKLSGDLR